MLSTLLRAELLIIALLFIITVIYNVNRKKLLLQYSLVWMALAFGMILLAIFPNIASFLTVFAGIEEPSNLIYAVGLFVLLFFAFHYTARVSKQASDIRTLIEQEAINRFLLQQYLKMHHENPEEEENTYENSRK